MATSTVLEKYLPEAKESLLWVPGIELIFRIAENKAQNKHTSEDGNSPMTARRYFVFSQAKMTTSSKNKLLGVSALYKSQVSWTVCSIVSGCQSCKISY